jgi:hypothetical protein
VLLGRVPEILLQIVSRILPEIVCGALFRVAFVVALSVPAGLPVPEIAGAGHWPAPGFDVNADYFIRMVLMLVVRS